MREFIPRESPTRLGACTSAKLVIRQRRAGEGKGTQKRSDKNPLGLQANLDEWIPLIGSIDYPVLIKTIEKGALLGTLPAAD